MADPQRFAGAGRVLVGAILMAAALAPQAGMVFEAREFSSPENERRYHRLIEELRCLVCQNQTIAESNADLASDLRREVHRMIEEGLDEDDVADFMVARYGDFILYRPPLRPGTILLWSGPFVAAAMALIGLLIFVRRRTRAGRTPIDAATREQLNRLVQDD